MMMTVAEVIQINIIQNEIEEEGRTTVMSILGFFQNLAMIVFCSFYAFLSNNYSLRFCFILVSLYSIAGVFMILFIDLVIRRLRA